MFKLVLAIASLVFVAGANAQSFQSIENCRQMVDGADRVACYDALKPVAETTPQPKIEQAAKPSHAEQSCEMLAFGVLLSNTSNCQEGDVVKVSGMDARELSEVVVGYCDFGAQILTFPDPTSSGLVREPHYVVLCKYHERKTAPRQ